MQGEGNIIVCGTVAAICKLQRIQSGRQHRADVVSDEFLKTLAEDGCQSNGPPVIQACIFIFLRYGHNGGFFEA